ncbi:hypothetical protein [Basilea psittacipulmonis]|nr:hypothetical protein [Basilea psittacipulmonis]
MESSKERHPSQKRETAKNQKAFPFNLLTLHELLKKNGVMNS